MSSSAAGLIKLIDLALAASTALEEWNGAISRINSKLRQAQEEGRDITFEELEEVENELDSLISKGRDKIKNRQ